jgi:PAS domain S-box-containing protein
VEADDPDARRDGKMKYLFSDLIDMPAMSALFEDFFFTTGLRCEILTLNGTLLTSSPRWQTACLQFHRANPVTSRRCLESDTRVCNSLLRDREYGIYRCMNGMIDAASRIMVRGEHVANIFCGQFFCEKPDLDWFRRQARDFGFDEQAYLAALLKVPVVPRERLETALKFVSRLAGFLGELGLRHLTALEAQESAVLSENKYRAIFENAVEGIFQTGLDGSYISINPALAHMHGYDSPEGMMSRAPSMPFHIFEDSGERARYFSLLSTQGRVKGFESRADTKEGRKIWVSINARTVDHGDGTATYEGTMENITDRKTAESAMFAAQERLEALSRTLLKKMEIERHYVAHELHDEVGQALTVVKMGLETIRKQPSASSFAKELDESIAAIRGAIGQVRNISVNLRPAILDDLGLVAALRWLAASITSKGGPPIEVRADDRTENDLSPGMATTCFRVAQEAMTNVLRHAGASNVAIGLRRLEDGVELEVDDNGVGFDVGSVQTLTARGQGFGLLAMQERVNLSGGSLEIESAPGRGSRITARFPLKKG